MMRSWELKGSKLKGIYFSVLEQEINKTVISCDHKFDPFVLILSLWILSMNWWQLSEFVSCQIQNDKKYKLI